MFQTGAKINLNEKNLGGYTHFKSERSIVKLIEIKSDLSKLSTLSEPSIVKFIENQS